MQKQYSILVVDDDTNSHKIIRYAFDPEEFVVTCVQSNAEALAHMKTQEADIIIAEASGKNPDAFEFLTTIKTRWKYTNVIFIAKNPVVNEAVELIQHGAFHYMINVFEEITRLVQCVKNGVRMKRVELENELLRLRMKSTPWLAMTLSQNPVMQGIFPKIIKGSRIDRPILFIGEHGCGRSLIANGMHERSSRQNHPFILMQCERSANNDLILFGNEHDHGLIGEAEGGTLYVNDFDRLSPLEQVRLAQVCEQKTVTYGDTSYPADVRIMLGTVYQLDELLQSRRMRGELSRCINLEIHIPNLDTHKEDIPHIAYGILSTFDLKHMLSISNDAITALTRASWPGQVTELRNTIEAAALRATGQEITLEDLPENIRSIHVEPSKTQINLSGVNVPISLELPFRDAQVQVDQYFRTAYFSGLMSRFQTVSAAARHAGMDRTNFPRMLHKFGIK